MSYTLDDFGTPQNTPSDSSMPDLSQFGPDYNPDDHGPDAGAGGGIRESGPPDAAYWDDKGSDTPQSPPSTDNSSSKKSDASYWDSQGYDSPQLADSQTPAQDAQAAQTAASYWDDKGSDTPQTPAPASYWDDKGSDTPQLADSQTPAADEAVKQANASYWDDKGSSTPQSPDKANGGYSYTPGVDVPQDELDSVGQAASSFYSNPNQDTARAYQDRLAVQSDDQSNLNQAYGTATQQVQDNITAAYPSDLGNLEQAAQQAPTAFSDFNDAMNSGATSFTTPSGQAVTRVDDGSGYSHWSIAGADDPNNVLYNDNGNWRAISRDEAATLQQQGAAANQFSSVANADSIAGQAMQSVGETPQSSDFMDRLKQAGLMIATATGVAAGGSAAATTLADSGLLGFGGVSPAVTVGGAYLTHGLAPTVGGSFAGIPGAIANATQNVPVLGEVTQQIASIPIPQLYQNPLANIEQVATTMLHDPVGFVGNPASALAGAVFTNALANAPTKDPMGIVRGLYTTEDPVRYAEQQGLQRAGIEMLLTSTFTLQNPVSHPFNWLDATNPVDRFHQVFTDELAKSPADPNAAATNAYQRTTNAVAEWLHTYDVLNPLWFAVDVPGLNTLIGDVLGNTARVAVKGIDLIVPQFEEGVARPVADFFMGLSRKSGAELAARGYGDVLATMTGRLPSTPDALGELYRIGMTYRTDPLAAAQAADQYVANFGGNRAGVLSMSNRLVAGAEDRYLARATPATFDVGLGRAQIVPGRPVAQLPFDQYMNQVISDYTSRNFTFDELKRAQDAARLFRATDGPTIEAYAALGSAQRDLIAATYRAAGLNLNAIENPGLGQRFISFGADTLRTLFLLPGAPALAVKKIVDEAIRSSTQGVFGVRPADLQLVRTGARFLEGSGNDFLRSIGARIENASTVRQYMARGLPVGRELLRTPESTRMALSPFRMTDKVLDSLVSSPTQHVRLNAAYKELATWDAMRPQMAANFAENIARSFDPLAVDRRAIANEAYARALTARSPQDFADLAQEYRARGGRIATEPGVPASGTAKGAPFAPSRPVTEQMARTGGPSGYVREVTQNAPPKAPLTPAGTRLPVNEQGRAPLPKEIAPEKYAGIAEEPIAPARLTNRERAAQTDAAIRAAGGNINAVSKEDYIAMRSQELRDRAKDYGTASRSGNIQARGRAVYASDKERFAQEYDEYAARTPGVSVPVDMAAGDGGAGYLSRQQRAIRDDLNAMGGFGTGTTRDFKPGTPPGQGGRRVGVTDELIKAWADGKVNPENVIANAQRELAAARASNDVPRQHMIEDWLLDHGQAASVAKDKAAHDLLNAARQEMFGPSTVSPALRAIRRGDELAAARAETPVNPRAATEQRVRERLGQAGINEPIAPNPPRVPGRDAFYTPVQPDPEEIARYLEEGRAARAARTPAPTDFTTPQQPPGPPLQLGAGERATPLQLGAGPRTTNFTVDAAGRIVPGVPLSPPVDTQAIAAGYSRAAQVARVQSSTFGQAQTAAAQAGIARGNRIIGNFMEQTPFGELASQGTINGRQVFAPLVPFAPFHIHTTQFWANYFLQHPAVPFAIARALGAANFDEYGGRQMGNRYVSGLLELSTAAKLVEWARNMYAYARDAILNPNGNNPLQTAAKIAGQALFGNEAYIRPFDYLGAPAQAVLQSTTNPMYQYDKNGQVKRDFVTGQPLVDAREQMKEQGSLSPFTAAANLGLGALGVNAPRNIVNGVTNPAEPITNLIRQGAVRGVNALGGNANLKQYTDNTAFAYFLGDYAQKHGLDPKFVQQAVYKPMTDNDVAFGQQLRAAFNRQQDMDAMQKFSPVRAVEQGTAKGIFPPTQFNDNSQAFFNARDFAGEGGKDAGIRLPGKNGGYYMETPERAAYVTADNQLKLSPSLSTAPTADYARDFLQQTGYQPPANATLRDNAGTSAYFDARQQALTGQIAGNASRFGAGLPQDQRVQYLGAVGQELAPGFTVSGLINQPGNVRDLLKQYEQAKAAGASPEQLKAILARVDDAQAKDLAQFPQTKAYFDFENQQRGYTPGEPKGYAGWGQNQKDAWDAFNDLRNSADYKQRSVLESQIPNKETDPQGYRDWFRQHGSELTRLDQIVYQAEQSIVDRYGINPKELANQIETDAGKNPLYKDTGITAPKSTSYPSSPSSSTKSAGGSSYRAPSRSTSKSAGSKASYGGSGGTSTGASFAATQQAGDDFYGFWRGLSGAEKHAVTTALDNARANPIGQKGATAEQYTRALDIAKAAVDTYRGKGSANPYAGVRANPYTDIGGSDPELIERYGYAGAYERMAARRAAAGGAYPDTGAGASSGARGTNVPYTRTTRTTTRTTQPTYRGAAAVPNPGRKSGTKAA